jgi:hypothetical protein
MNPNRPGERGAVLQGLEVRLRVGVVVGHVRPRVGARHPQIDQQLRDRLGGHRAAAVGMDGELALVDALGSDRVSDEVTGELGVLGRRDHPRNQVARVDVDDHVQVVPRVGPWSLVMSHDQHWSEPVACRR